MSRSALLQEITATYQKFGWTLRTVLLTEEARREFVGNERNVISGNLPIENSDICALWFSRVSGNRETWELRLLSVSAFALIETFEHFVPELERAQTRMKMKEKMRANAPKFKI